MSEREDVLALANKLLDEPWCDPDDDLRTLARQLLRREEQLEAIWSRCRVVFYPREFEYPIEHSLAARKDMRRAIEHALFAAKRERA